LRRSSRMRACGIEGSETLDGEMRGVGERGAMHAMNVGRKFFELRVEGGSQQQTRAWRSSDAARRIITAIHLHRRRRRRRR
jgi:hypothetical protein